MRVADLGLLQFVDQLAHTAPGARLTGVDQRPVLRHGKVGFPAPVAAMQKQAAARVTENLAECRFLNAVNRHVVLETAPTEAWRDRPELLVGNALACTLAAPHTAVETHPACTAAVGAVTALACRLGIHEFR